MYLTYFDYPNEINKKKYSSFDKLIFFLYALYFILNPFYFWKSGLPQIADFIMVLIFLFYAIKNKFRFKVNKLSFGFLKIGAFFVVWVIFVNLIWSSLLQNPRGFLISTLFYIYNFLVATLIITLYAEYKEKILTITYYSVLTSLIIQMVFFIVGGAFSGGRVTGSFNNPNQLGYYSLLAAAILIFLSNKIKLQLKWFLIAMFCTLTLTFASLSKAAILSFIGLIITFLFFGNKNKILKKRLIVIAILALIPLWIIGSTTTLFRDNLLLNSVQERLQEIGEDSDDNLEGRGYDRIYDYPEYWIIGAGEGEYNRFNNESLTDLEFHSTIGNIQVSYGLIGTILFFNLIIATLKNDRYRSSYIILFIFAYGLSHNGIRDTFFWVLLALINTHSINGSNSKKKQSFS